MKALRARVVVASMLLALVAPLSASRAFAQPADVGEGEAAYKMHMQNGVKLYQEKNWPGAIAEFDAAYKAKPKASPLVNIALSYKNLFDYPRAIRVLEDALGKHTDSLTPGDKKAAEDAITEMKALLGYVTLELSPPTATVSVDGSDLPKDAAQKPIPLGPGTHRIGARAEGYAPKEETVSIASGDKDKKLSLKLAPDKGYVTIRAVDPKTAIAVDQKGVGYGAWAGFLAPGTHLVQMYTPGGSSSYSVQVLVSAGKSQDVKEGLGGMITSGPAGAQSRDEEENEKKEPPQPPVRGFYGLLTGAVYGVTADPSSLDSATNRPGFAGGLRFGYRIITILGIEAMFQYGASGGEGAVQTTEDNPTTPRLTESVPGDYDIKSLRIGANVRLMTKGKTVRFVGTIGGGVAYDTVSFGGGFASIVSDPGDNVTGYALLEPGLELEFQKFIIGVALPIMPTFSDGDESDTGGSTFGNTFAQAGLQLRAGYGFW